MSFCSYNIRGLNKKTSFVKDFILSKNIGLIDLFETHVKKDSASFIANLVSSNFSWLFNYDSHSNGRIWVGWDPSKWKVQTLVSSSQHISCSVSSFDDKISFIASFVYALNTAQERKQLWSQLLQFKNSICVNGLCPP